MIELMVLGLLGVILHYTKEWIKANKEGKAYNLKRSIPMGIFSVLTTILLIYLKDDIADLYPVTKFTAIALGYTGNSVIFSFLETKKPKVNEADTTE